jgi:endoglucanase
MSDILPFLKTLLTTAGLSAYEAATAGVVAERWSNLVDDLQRSRLGSLHGLQRGHAPAPRPALMVAAHMDSIGLMVSGIKDGFLRISKVGGVDERILPGQQVIVHTRAGDLPAVIAQPPARLLPPEIRDAVVPLEYLFVDTGLPPRQVEKIVQVGDRISFATSPLDLSGETLAGPALDNRASLAALTLCLETLRTRPHAWDVWAVATVQEEVGLIGAYTSAYDLRPALALVVDVTWAKGPGASEWNTFPLGGGPTIALGANVHPHLHQALKETAERLEIPHAMEYMPRHSGTDAFATQVTAEGIPTAIVGIPLRYMHTPVEVVALKDIQRAGRLLAEFIAGLEVDFLR